MLAADPLNPVTCELQVGPPWIRPVCQLDWVLGNLEVKSAPPQLIYKLLKPFLNRFRFVVGSNILPSEAAGMRGKQLPWRAELVLPLHMHVWSPGSCRNCPERHTALFPYWTWSITAGHLLLNKIAAYTVLISSCLIVVCVYEEPKDLTGYEYLRPPS